MSKERRISPRKDCAVPVRFRILANGNLQKVLRPPTSSERQTVRSSAAMGVLDGEAINLSERGIYFWSRQAVRVGDPLEMFLTLPRELTGRDSEQVRCSARVVHIDESADIRGRIGIGAAVERFETLLATRNWGN